MPGLFPIASGKGGVGKSLLTANLGVSLAALGKSVILIDLDLGGSNLHTFLGVKNRNPGIGSLINKQADTLQSLVVPTRLPRLFLVPGDALLPGTANLPYFMKQRIIREIASLDADLVLLDLGAGSTFNTIDFFLTSPTGVLITTPETTAILNAYAFLKNTVFRALYRAFPSKGPERQAILEFLSRKIEGTQMSVASLVRLLEQSFPSTGGRAARILGDLLPRIVINMAESQQDLHVGAKLRDIVNRNLGISLDYIGFVHRDPAVARSVTLRTPASLTDPGSPFSRSVRLVARALVRIDQGPMIVLHPDDDMGELEQKLEAI